MTNDFEVISFSQGEMKEVNGNWVILEEAVRINYKVNGTCVYNKERIPCMWHGYILEYDSFGRDVELNCKMYMDRPSDMGNPNEIEKRNTYEYSYTIKLKGSEKRFVNPQYASFNPNSTDVTSVTVCSVYGKPVLEFKKVILANRPPIKT